MKPKYLILRSIFIYCLCVLFGLSAHSQVEFFVESANVDPGQHFSLKTTVKKFDKIVSMQFTIKWDPTVLTLDSIGGMTLSGLSQSSFGTNKKDQGIVSVSWIDFSAQGKTLNDGSTLFNLYFEAVGVSGNKTDVDITSVPIVIEITDAASNGEDIGAIVNKGVVEIAVNKPSVYFDSTTINLPGSACNLFKTSGLTTLKKLTGTISWDPAKLAFDSICCMHPLIASNYFNTSFTTSGNILVNIDNQSIPLTLKDQLFGVCFTAKGMAFDEAEIDLNSSLFPYDIKTVPAGSIKFKKGRVSLLLDNVNLGGSDQLAKTGEIIEIPIVSKSPLQLQIIQGGFTYNTSELQYVGFKKAKLSAFNIDSLNLTSVSLGKIGFHYALPASPLSIKTNDTLLFLQFKVLVQTGSTELRQSDFTYNPMAVLNYNQLILLPLSIDTTLITILPKGVKLATPGGSGVSGEIVCIPIAVEGFENIGEINLPVLFDPLLLEFVSIEPLELPSDPLFNLSLNPGTLVFNWKDYPGSAGSSISDGDILLNLCFKLIGSPGSIANIEFDSLNAYVKRADFPGEDFNLSMNNAQIIILGSAPMEVEGFITNNPCDGDKQGKIDLEISGGKGPFQFEWQDGIKSQNRDQLPDGTYTVVITDSSVPPQVSTQFFILTHYGNKPIFTAIGDQSIACPDDTIIVPLDVNTYQLSWIGNSPGLAKFENSKAFINQGGQYIYQLYDISSSCFSQDTFLVIPPPFMESAFAGADQKACDEALVSAFQTGSVFGNWSTLSSATIVDAGSSTTSIINLESGPNLFVWTISTSDCPNYDTDTLLISVPFPAIAFNDTLNIKKGKSMNILENDLKGNGAFFIVMPDSMPPGLSVDKDGLLQYKDNDDIISMSIQYNLCSTECPMLCSSALIILTSDTSSVVVPGGERIPNAISPNNDGINDQLEFPQLDPMTHTNAKFIVFDKQGRILYKDYHYKNNWNGVDDQYKDLPIDTYYYALWLSLSSGEVIKGPVTILR